MIEQIEYYEKNGGAVICRCYGEGSFAELPSVLNGLLVTELADHCFAPEGSVRLPQGGMRIWQARPGAEHCTQEQAMCGSSLTQIVLPESLQAIGDYAFYNCYALEELYIPAGVNRLGRGVFVAANHIRRLRFGCDEKRQPMSMRDVIGEVTYEVEVIWEMPDGRISRRLIYPEYYEDSVENTPARIIVVAYEGTGYKYRQCFRGQEPDMARYDALFYTASVQEYPPTVLHMALARLETPVDLSEEAKEAYLTYLKKEAGAAARYVLQEGSISLLKQLGEEGYFEETVLQCWLDVAARLGEAEAAAYLMDLLQQQKKAAHPPVHKYEW